jgi:hypothetical protein
MIAAISVRDIGQAEPVKEEKPRAVPAKPAGRPSQEPEKQERKEPPQQQSSSYLAVGLFLLIIGTPLWIVGARYTVDGAIVAINWFLNWLTIPHQVHRPQWEGYLLWIAAAGLAFSIIEVRHRPRRIPKNNKEALTGAAWCIAVVIDLGTTYLAVTNPGRGAWPITYWIAGNITAAGAWTILATFGPEWAIMGAWKLLTSRR